MFRKYRIYFPSFDYTDSSIASKHHVTWYSQRTIDNYQPMFASYHHCFAYDKHGFAFKPHQFAYDKYGIVNYHHQDAYNKCCFAYSQCHITYNKCVFDDNKYDFAYKSSSIHNCTFSRNTIYFNELYKFYVYSRLSESKVYITKGFRYIILEMEIKLDYIIFRRIGL
jgi:hypothetical protein